MNFETSEKKKMSTWRKLRKVKNKHL